MKQLTCEMCGGTDLVKDGGVFVCQSCGTKYSVEEAKKMMVEVSGTVEVKQSDFIIVAGELIEYRGEATKVIIPDNVITIGEKAFYYMATIKEVCMPDSVTLIESDAFKGCKGLTSIIIPNSVTSIKASAFEDCTGLKSVTIPSSIENLGHHAFNNCNGLKTAGPIGSGCDFEFGWKNRIPNDAFDECQWLTNITFPETITNIDNRAFWSCDGLTSVIIPNGVTNIGARAFGACGSLTSISIPNSVNNIAADTFYMCYKLYQVNLPEHLKLSFDPKTRMLVNIDGKTNSTSGCYVATCIYGSYDCPQVWTLRRYRDNTLASTWYGRAFIRTYYAISPTLVKLFGNTNWFKNMWKPTLDCIVKKLQSKGVEKTPYKDKNLK